MASGDMLTSAAFPGPGHTDASHQGFCSCPVPSWIINAYSHILPWKDISLHISSLILLNQAKAPTTHVTVSHLAFRDENTVEPGTTVGVWDPDFVTQLSLLVF